ncbi:MAG: hypothetical protein GF364_12445 [Candidatus Lokiarchaeota archaeon]|nr:hypothetical protein [Candidatus Lokiarchaeota archaeon]
MMFFLIVNHALLFCLFDGVSDSDFFFSQNPIITVAIFPFAIISTWAVIFGLVSGTANAYNLYLQIDKHKKNLGTRIKHSSYNGIYMLIFHFIFLTFFTHRIDDGTGIPKVSLITGSIINGELFIPDLMINLFSDALFYISFSNLIVNALLYILWRKEGFKKSKRNFIILIGTVVFWLILTPVLRHTLYPIYIQQANNRNFFKALFLAWLVGPRHSIFPFVAFAIIGAIFGIAQARNVEIFKIKKYSYSFSFICFIISLIYFQRDGFPDFGAPLLEPSIYMLNASLLILISAVLIDKVDNNKPKTQKKIAQKTVVLRRTSIASFTIYVLEAPIAASLAKIFNFLFGGDLANSALAIGLYFLSLWLIWHLILRNWSNYNFKYGCEWLNIQIMTKLRGRKSMKLNIKEILYNPFNLTKS